MPATPVLYAFADSAAFAARLARKLSLPLKRVGVHVFPDGETLVQVAPPTPRAAVLVRSLDRPNEKLVETVLAADALRRSGAAQVTLVAPYLPYMRQDAVFHAGQALSQRVVADLLGRSFDRVLTIEAHLHRIESLASVFPCAAQSLSAAGAIAAWIGAESDALVVGPDRESRPWVEAIAAHARLASAVGEKQRASDRRVRVELASIPLRRRAVIVDDIGSSGATLAATARALRRAGITRIDAVVVHALFSPGALARISRAGVGRVVSCNCVSHRTNAIDVSPVIAAALRAKARKEA